MTEWRGKVNAALAFAAKESDMGITPPLADPAITTI
jgi:hypothetical protein